MKTSRPLQARENVGDQVVIGFLYASDWLRRWHEFSRHDPIPDDFRHNWNCFNLDFVLQTDETPQGKRKKKVKKDADAPKRPMSGYMLWLSEIREQIKGENPGISVTELSKVAGEKWKKIEDKTVNDLCIPYISIMREWWLCKVSIVPCASAQGALQHFGQTTSSSLQFLKDIFAAALIFGSRPNLKTRCSSTRANSPHFL